MAAIRLPWLLLHTIGSICIAGCTSYEPQLPPVYERGTVVNGGADPQQNIPVRPTPEATERLPDTDSATLALLQQSQRAQDSGNAVEAAAYIERAIRLNPRQADLWLRLAKLHLAQQDLEPAIQYANKAIALAGTRMDWVQQAWLVIADARAAQGDLQTAQEIRSKWRTYRG